MMSACFCPTVFHFSSGGATPEFSHSILVLSVFVPVAETKGLGFSCCGSEICCLFFAIRIS